MAVQRGEIKNVTNAVMAGMAIDRIAKNAMKPPEMTVAQEVFAPPQTGVAAAQQMQGQPAVAGLDQIPISEGMFTAANGGIVAFESGGTPIERLLKMMNGQERAEYQTTGKIPARLQNLTQPQAASGEPYGGADAVFARPAVNAPIDMTFNNAASTPTPRGRTAAAPSGTSNLPSTAQTAAQQAAVQQGTTPLGVEEEFNQDFAMIQRVLGEDPTRARLKALYEKQEKEAEANARTDNAMRLIEAGLAVAGGTSPYAGANFALAAPAVRGAGEDTRARRKEATERAKGMAELEGMTRKEKADILTQTMARRREDKKTQEDRDFRRELVRLQKSLEPEDFKRYAARIFEKGTPAQKAAIEKVLESSRGSSGQLTANQLANLRAKAVENAAGAAYKDRRYQMAKTPEDKAAVMKIIEREEFEKLVPDNESWGEVNVTGAK